ncbi:hypothetical protein SAMN05444166_4239 [Singulisphaera sp. GP187]|uniref:hypothetical protein n=1 Tax=Singulisphaera sp. GP187 TaxID=1882752 RepID=UPI000927E4F2|nr:hypothetical protein [Singulisphaera sp. GP187]SIO38074.1 hypothetical protein SAMN05444166_4239 [Singulisphaera sp. GP187]
MFELNNPQSLLRPWKNLTQFSEELYAMFTRKGPDTQPSVTPATKSEPNQDSLKPANRTDNPIPATRTTLRARPTPLPSVLPTEATKPDRSSGPIRPMTPPQENDLNGRVVPPVTLSHSTLPVQAPLPPQPPLPKMTDVAQPLPPQVIPAPYQFLSPVQFPSLAEITGPEPPKFQQPPQTYDPIKQEIYKPPGFEIPDAPDARPIGGGGTTVFIGKVKSGTGKTYQVNLYPNGPNGDPQSPSVSVEIPTIDPDEQIDPNTWLFGIFQFSDSDGNDIYFAQPTVWMD